MALADVSLIPSSSFWAKLTYDEAQTRVIDWHSLIAHSADVAASAHVLLERTVLRRRFASLLGRPGLDATAIQRLCVWVALHDMGKVNLGFQRRAARPWERGGHVGPLVNLLDGEGFACFEAWLDLLDIERLQSWLSPRDQQSDETLCAMLLATLAHHGRPVAIDGSSIKPHLWEPELAETKAPFDGMRALFDAITTWFPLAFEPASPTLPDLDPWAIHAFNGLVTLADWLGSDRQTFRFDRGTAERDPLGYFTETLERARVRQAAMGLVVDKARQSLGADTPTLRTFSPRFDARPMQRVCEQLELDPRGSVVVLESDTGSGKTEAALIHFLRLFHAGLVDGLYFALPTRTAATQLHTRLVAAIAQAFEEGEHRPAVTLAVPGYLRVDAAEGERFGRFEVRWDDASRNPRYWAAESAKRYLAGAIVVGTIDQALLSALNVNHSHMRATALLRSLLVIDEVHASDHYMTQLTRALLRHHCKQAGGHALLMSATLGASAQSRLLKAVSVQDAELEPLKACVARHYPIVSCAVPGERLVSTPCQPSAYVKRIERVLMPWMEDEHLEALVDRAVDQALQGARVLILRNTVKGCVMTQRALEARVGDRLELLMRTSQGVAVAHHSRFARADRLRLDALIESCLGKRSVRQGLVIVATQTVQQSLDLDADVMWTDLCPMDVLLQRAGRLHRHPERVRPQAQFEQPRLYVLTPESRSMAEFISPRHGGARGPHGLGTVYEDLRVLEATWQELEHHQELVIPTMNRQLVEQTTHPERLEAVAHEALGELGASHQTYLHGQLFADSAVAQLALLDRTRRFQDCIFPSSSDERIATRLGEQDRQVNFEPSLPSPLGAGAIATLALPAHLCRGLEGELEPAQVEVTPAGFTFLLGHLAYAYDRLGVRHHVTDT